MQRDQKDQKDQAAQTDLSRRAVVGGATPAGLTGLASPAEEIRSRRGTRVHPPPQELAAAQRELYATPALQLRLFALPVPEPTA